MMIQMRTLNKKSPYIYLTFPSHILRLFNSKTNRKFSINFAPEILWCCYDTSNMFQKGKNYKGIKWLNISFSTRERVYNSLFGYMCWISNHSLPFRYFQYPHDYVNPHISYCSSEGPFWTCHWNNNHCHNIIQYRSSQYVDPIPSVSLHQTYMIQNRS